MSKRRRTVYPPGPRRVLERPLARPAPDPLTLAHAFLALERYETNPAVDEPADDADETEEEVA